MNTIVATNRHKDTMKWRALALEYEMKISYLERALAQEESKLRIAEQVADRSTFCCVGWLVRRFIRAYYFTPIPQSQAFGVPRAEAFCTT